MGRPRKEDLKGRIELNYVDSKDLDLPKMNFEDGLIEEVKMETKVEEEKEMNPSNKNWTTHILGLLWESELKNGNPTCEGLRRVAEELIGEIIESTTVVNQCPTSESNRATVTHTLVFQCHKLGKKMDLNTECCEVLEPTKYLKYSGSADVSSLNTEKPFVDYPTATADTRAEGRALKRALKLRCLVSEEVKNKSEEVGGEDLITAQQISFLDTLCQQMNLSVIKVLERVLSRNNISVKKVTFEEAQAIMKALSGFRNNLSGIDQDLKGFSADWKS